MLAWVKSIWFDQLGGWKRRLSVLSEASAIRARPVHGKGTSHLNRNPTTNDDLLSARFVDTGH
jgi:hypothetical protein